MVIEVTGTVVLRTPMREPPFSAMAPLQLRKVATLNQTELSITDQRNCFRARSARSIRTMRFFDES
jgi:hypothetical protein